MADAPENEALNETSTPKTYLASVVCQVIRTRDLRDKGQIQLRWSANGRFFPPYLVPVDKLETCIAAVRNAIQSIVTALENVPEMLKSPGEIHDGVSLNSMIIELAKAGKSLYDRLLPKEDATQREIEKWLKMLAAEDRVDTVEIQIDDECADDLTKPLPTIPWNLLFDDKLIKPAELLARLNSGAVDDWGYFWGAKFDLSCGKNVNPLKADSPIDLETVTLVVMMDETILANLHQDAKTKAEFEDLLQRIDALRDPDSPAGKIVHLMHDMASLESFIEERNQTPDVLYWLSHAKPDSLYLEFLDGREGEEVTVDRLASTFAAAENPKRLVAFLNGCQTAEASKSGSFLNAFRKFDFCDGLIATERETLDVFAHRFGMEFLESFFIRQLPLGRILHNLRRSSLPLGLLYGTYCPPNIRIVRKSDMKAVKRSAPYRIAPELGASLRKLSAAALTTARETRLANATVKPPAPPQPWPDKPYPSLGFYTLKDQSLFLGRDDDSARLAELIDTPTTRILLLHGTSGSGKSSVIRAGLVPYLEANAVGYSFPRRPQSAGMGETEELHLFFRPSDNFAARLAADLLAFTDPANPYRLEPRPDGTPQSPMNLRPVLARCVDPQASDVMLAELQAALDNPKRPELFCEILDALTAAIPEKLVVTIDQAEELYTLGQGDTPEEIQRAEDRRKQAFALLRGCLRGSGRWKVILSYRTEYHGRITDGIRAGLRKNPGLVDYLITDLNKAQLRQVIERPTLDCSVVEGLEPPRQKFGFTYEPGVIDAIVDGIFRLRGHNTDSVLPIAQVVCTRLYEQAWANAGKDQVAVVRKADLERLRHRRRLGRNIGTESNPGPVSVDSKRGAFIRRKTQSIQVQAKSGGSSKDAGGTEPVLEILEDFAESTVQAVANGNRHVAARLKSLIMQLYLTQPDGTLTTAQIDKPQFLKHFGSGSKVSLEVVLEQAAKMRLLRMETVTGSLEAEEATIRLGHDTLCKVAGRWDAAEEAKRRARKFQNWVMVATVICSFMMMLVIKANRSEKIAIEREKEAIEAADLAKRFAFNANLILSQNLFEQGRDFEVRKKLFTIPAEHRSFPWGLMKRQISARSLALSPNHSDSLNSIVWSPNGRLFASGSEDRTVKLWDGVSGRLIATLEGHGKGVSSIAFSLDGKTLASGSYDKTIRLWDVATGVQTRSPLAGHTGEVLSVAFSPDGKTLASGSYDKTIRLWDVATGVQTRSPLARHTGEVLSAAFSPDGKSLASCSSDNTIRIWDVVTGAEKVTPLAIYKFGITSVAFSQDGKTLATGSYDRKIRLWDLVSGTSKGTPLVGHKGVVHVVAFSPDGKMLASGGEDRTIRLWDVATGVPKGPPLAGHLNSISCVAFSPDGKTLTSGDEDKKIRLWDVVTGNAKRMPSAGHTGGIDSVAFSPDGKMLASGGEDRTIRLWDVATGVPKESSLTGHTGRVLSIAFSPDGKILASGAEDMTIRLWDVATGVSKGSPLIGHAGEVHSVTFSPDGKTLASGTEDQTIRLWDVATGVSKGSPLIGHAGEVHSVTFSPDGKTLASGAEDRTIRLWDVTTGVSKELLLIGHAGEVHSVTFSPDGKTLASGAEDRTIRLWDVTTGVSKGPLLAGHKNIVSSVAFSPDGKTLASGGEDQTIRLWDVATGVAKGPPLVEHTNIVSSVVFSPDGKTLASGSQDQTIRLWDVATGVPQGSSLVGHSDLVSSVAFSPDGKTLASGSFDQTIRLWDVATGVSKGSPLVGHTGRIHSVAFSPDGKTLASGALDQTIRLWDVVTSTEVRNLELQQPIHSVAFTTVVGRVGATGGLRLAAASGNEVRILDSEFDAIDTKRIRNERIARNFLRLYRINNESIAAVRQNETLTSDEKNSINAIIQPLIDLQKSQSAAKNIP